jgi:hypothetical protein
MSFGKDSHAELKKKLEYYTTAWYLNRKTRVFEKIITPAQNLSKWIFFFLTEESTASHQSF